MLLKKRFSGREKRNAGEKIFRCNDLDWFRIEREKKFAGDWDHLAMKVSMRPIGNSGSCCF